MVMFRSPLPIYGNDNTNITLVQAINTQTASTTVEADKNTE
jgi:hypothetical protein